MFRINNIMKGFAALLTIFFMFVNPARAVCPTGFELLNLVNWSSIFPISIAGIEIAGSTDNVATIDSVTSPICVCPMSVPPYFRIGLTVGFWEPARLVETVKDPGCFPSMGFSVPVASGTNLAGSNGSAEGSGSDATFAQAHYFIYPIWGLLGLLTDWACVESAGFDVAYMTEFDPLWQDDSMAAILNPEAVLFGNPAAQLACIADSVSATAGLSLSPLFWCMGSWGSAYPLTGHMDNSLYVTANAGIAARMLYKMAREMLVCDTNIDLCGCVQTPIWVKHNYKFQEGLPVRDFEAHPIGRSGLLWTSAKNPPFVGDNFAWVLFRRRNCCAF